MNNISIVSIECCTGCNSCMQVCPKHCIARTEIDGFWYPEVNEEVCIECGKCLKVCLAQKPMEHRKPLQCYAGYNTDDDIRMKSSSGGTFYALAKSVIDKDGVVFGAVFDEEWNVVHRSAKNIEDVMPMLGSKYLQSDTLETFQECRKYLKEGVMVLYSGSPCQVGALYKFLGKTYENLVTIDFICHGVPSPGIWLRYLAETFGTGKITIPPSGGRWEKYRFEIISKCKAPIGGIKFRDKSDGWEKFRFEVRQKSASKADKNSVLKSDIFSNNPYMRGFLNDLYLRESCYHCPARCFSSWSDVTIGDFWGVHKLGMDDLNDQKGLSIITINTGKGKSLFDEISNNFITRDLTYEQALISNDNLVRIAKRNTKRINTFRKYKQQMPLSEAIDKTLHLNFIQKVFLKAEYKLHITK